LEGIFQYHQAVILQEAGYRVGALSVRLSFSVPMILKGLVYKVLGRKAANATDEHSIASLIGLGAKKIFQPQKFISRDTLDGISVYRIDALYRRKPSNNRNHVSWIKGGLICFETYLKNEGQPDIIHAHDAIYAGMLAERIYAKYGIKYIITEHSSSFALGATDEGILHRVIKAHERATGLFAVSESFAELLNGLFHFKRFRYLPNVLDQYLEKAEYQTASVSNPKFRFLHIAVFKPVKDQSTLLKAFKRLVEKDSNVDLFIGGDGELHDELQEQVASAGLHKSVHFLGRLNRDEVIAQLKACDCFVLSSKYETFGLVIAEAMLFGKPVISTRCGISQKIVDDKIGYVVEVGNEKQLADAMLKMMETKKTFDPNYIRDFTIRHFGKERFLENLNKIYKEAV
jgi:glycosyltransferase involved in cell wall biosynthesis